jgi:hypothetical protein
MKGIILKKLLISALSVGFLFTGCSEKINLDIFDKDIQYENALQYTKRGEIVNSLETKTVISATYLNSVDKATYKDGDYFLIGIYIPNDTKNSNALLNPNTKLTLNSKGFQSIEIVQQNSEEYKKFAFLNRWAKYYKVKFEKLDAPYLNLKYQIKDYGDTVLKFDKNL